MTGMSGHFILIQPDMTGMSGQFILNQPDMTGMLGLFISNLAGITVLSDRIILIRPSFPDFLTDSSRSSQAFRECPGE